MTDDPVRTGEVRVRDLPVPPRNSYQEAMTANDSTPETGQESIDIEGEAFPLEEATDEEIAQVIEQKQGEVWAASVAVRMALLDPERVLTDDAVGRLNKAANELRTLSGTLSRRVPPQGRAEE